MCSSCYTVDQAFHFNNLFNSREKITDIIKQGRYSQKTRDALVRVQEIVAYAKKQGLNVDDAYEYYISMENGDVSYIVSAADPVAFKFKTWWFPFVGSVPYLGFFDINDRNEKAQSLSVSYDVHVATVGAFSSLGWFEDPIYTPMLKRTEASLANLLFHELTHRTFWAQGSVRFNENLAEFVGYQMAIKYLKDKGEAQKLQTFLNRYGDRRVLKAWLKELKKDLEQVYEDERLDYEGKLQKKKATIARYQNEKMPQFKDPRYVKVAKRDWNNASIMGAGLYSPDFTEFEKAYVCSNAENAGQFLEALKSVETDEMSEFAALKSLCLKTNAVSS